MTRTSNCTPIHQFSSSEIELHGKLNDPAGCGAANHSGCARVDGGRRQPEVGMVEQIEELAAELQAPLLDQVKILVYACIPVEEARPP